MVVQVKKSKTQKVNDGLDQARQAAEIGKMVAPPEIDTMIDRGEQAIDAAKAGISLFDKINSLFRKKKK